MSSGFGQRANPHRVENNQPRGPSGVAWTIRVATPLLMMGGVALCLIAVDAAIAAKGGKGKGGGPKNARTFQMDMAESGGHFFWSTAETGSPAPTTNADDVGNLRFNSDHGANDNGHIHLADMLDLSDPDLSACFSDVDGDGIADPVVDNNTTHILLDDTVPGGVVVRLTFWALDLNGRDLKYRVFLSGFVALDDNGDPAVWDPLGKSVPDSEIQVGETWTLSLPSGTGSIEVTTIDAKKFHKPCSAGPFANGHDISVYIQRDE